MADSRFEVFRGYICQDLSAEEEKDEDEADDEQDWDDQELDAIAAGALHIQPKKPPYRKGRTQNSEGFASLLVLLTRTCECAVTFGRTHCMQIVHLIIYRPIDYSHIVLNIAIWPGDRIRRPEHSTVEHGSCDEMRVYSISALSGTNFALITKILHTYLPFYI